MLSTYASSCIPKRYWVTILSFFGICCMYLLRTNLAIVVVDMTSDRNVTEGNKTYVQPAEFVWNSQEKGFVMSLFSYGYIFTPLGGFLATRWGGATMFGAGTALTGLLTVLSPVLLRLNFWTFAAARVLEGIFEGFMVSGYVQIFVRWAPPQERSRMMVNAHVGGFFGAIVNYPLSGYLANHFGWEAVFYVTGGISLIWFAIWTVFVSNDPQKDRFISNAERTYLKEQIKGSDIAKINYPWKKIFTSKPVWAYMNDCFAASWSYSLLIYCLPLYVKDVYDVNIQDVGVISSIPSLFSIISEIIAANLADHLRSKRIMTIQNVHRLYIVFGQLSAIVLLFISGICGSFEGSIICFSVLRFCFCFAETSYEILPLDMASQFASLISGLGTCCYSFGCLLNPLVMGYMVSNHSAAEWNRYFLFLSIFNVWGSFVFWVFGSADLQPWAK